MNLQWLQALCEFPGCNLLCELITTLELGLNIFNFTEDEHNSIYMYGDPLNDTAKLNETRAICKQRFPELSWVYVYVHV